MRNRPWPLVALALFQVLTPVITVLFNAVLLGVHPKFVVGWIWERTPLEVFEAFALMPIAGVAIWWMKRWSYVVFFVAMAWSVWANVAAWSYVPGGVRPGLLGVYLFEIALVGYFLIPSVREAYFNPRVRWWESKPRYLIHAPGRLRLGDDHVVGEIVNLSEGGAFFRAQGAALKGGQQVVVEFRILALEFAIPARVVYAGQAGGDLGLQFEHTRESLSRFRDLVRGLALVGFVDRTPSRPWIESLAHWLGQLFKTGRGLTPDLPTGDRGGAKSGTPPVGRA